jgi:hypothetical protein
MKKKLSAMSSKEDEYRHWMKCGMPEGIARFIANFPNKESDPRIERARRFYNYWLENPDTEDTTRKAWEALQKNARPVDPGTKDPESLISLFLSMPDKLTDQAFPLIYGKRNIDPEEERLRYDKKIEHVKQVKKFFLAQSMELRELMTDAGSSQNGHEAARDFRQTLERAAVYISLSKLEKLLTAVDPFAKYPTKQWSSDDRASHIYIYLVADLNRHLAKPQWKALATLANINCPEVRVTNDALRKSHASKADKAD